MTKIKEKKIGRYCSCFQYKTQFIRPNRLREVRKGLRRRRICHLPLFVYFGKIIFDLMFECIRIVC